MTRVGILECDRPNAPALIAAADGQTYGAMYAHMLTSADASIETRVYDAVAGLLPARLDECDAWIITGSRHDAHGDAPWVDALRSFVRSLHAEQRRTVGVCFGHQLVAEALGGKAERSGEWRAGPERMDVESSPWFEAASVTIHAMHQDVVTELPEGARTIATGHTADVPAYVVSDHVLCIQDHPEYGPTFMAALVELRRDRLGDELADDALARIASVPTDGDVVARWIADFLLDRRSVTV